MVQTPIKQSTQPLTLEAFLAMPETKPAREFIDQQWDRIPRDADGRVANAFNLAPNWTIEILSPDQSQTKVVRNILHCLDNGAEMSWLIDPEERVVFVYFADRKISMVEQPAAQIPVPSFAGAFELTVGELFGWLDE